MSKQRPSKGVSGTESVAPVETGNLWLKRLFKNTCRRNGQRMKVEGWSVKIQQRGRRHTFSLGTPDKEAAAVEARAIYETCLLYTSRCV